jgi:predicted dehydrogenase
MKPLNIALIGCGAVAEHYYAPALAKLSEKVVVKAICDPARSRIEKLQQQLPKTLAVEKISQLPKDIDLAIVASPVGSHAEQSIEALKLGFSVLCEKPMATSVQQCQEMTDMANAKGKLLAIGHFRRQFPAAIAIKEVLSRQLLGKAKSFSFNEGSPFQWPAATGSLFKRKEAGGGVFMDLGVHMIDLALWWFGEIESQDYEDDSMGGVEANCRLQLRFKNGISGRCQLSRDWFLDNTYTIECERGTISWKITQATVLDVSSVDTANKQVHDLLSGICVPSLDEPDHLRAFSRQLEIVVEAVSQNTRPNTLVTGDEALKTMQLIESCYKQALLMAMPWLTEVELKQARLLHEGEVARG